MKTIPTLEQFTKSMTNGVGKKDRRFIEQYGDVSFLEAYPLYVQHIKSFFSIDDKIQAFENYLINLGVEATQSKVSESRYYYWKGVKYRFSSHVYPTGSMTSDFCVDLAADRHLIDEIQF